MPTIEQAIILAAKAHQGQKDKAGAAYILHPLRVMLSLKTEPEMIAAILHDIIEDTPYSLDDLKKEGYSEEIVDAVDCLTRRDDETYEAFIERASTNMIARNVKMEDLKDNMDLSRIENPGEDDYKRIEKYRKALEYLNSPEHLF